jgi:glycosyltransferase involved in cell wall biosynthesis
MEEKKQKKNLILKFIIKDWLKYIEKLKKEIKMKILYVNNFFTEYGGAEKTMYNESLLLEDKDVKTFFFATDKQPYLKKNYLYSKYFPQFINYKKFGIFNLFKLFYNIEAQKKLNKLLIQIKPDLVRCCNVYYQLTPSILKVCKQNKIPVVMSIHDCRLFCPSGNLMIKNNEYCKDLLCMNKSPMYCMKNLCKNNKFVPSSIVTLEYMFNKFFRLYENVDFYICQSQAMLELAAKSGISRNKIFLLNTFLSDNYFEQPAVYEKNSYFLYIGRISAEKGVDILINAMKNIPEIPIHIVGTGPDENYYKNLAKKYNLHNIKFMGYKSGHDLEEEYKNCIATVLPCNWFENFPRSVLESFAYGKPSIASRIGGIPEIIDEEINGFTFEVGNTELLTMYMKKLFYDKKLSVKMGQNARLKAETQYNSKVYLEKIFNIYNSIIG